MAKGPLIQYKPAWYARKSTQALLGVPSAVLAILGILQITIKTVPWLTWAFIAMAVLTGAVFVLRLVIALLQDGEAARLRAPDDLVGCMHVSHRAMTGLVPDEQLNLRMTIHRVDDEEVEQLVPYIGGSPKQGAGRRFSSRSGVVGRAITTGQPAVYHRARDLDFESYVRQCQEKLHMPASEAQLLTMTQFAFMAIPLHWDDAVGYVVFMDCDQPDFFRDPVMEALALATAAGVADYLTHRYDLDQESGRTP